MTMRTEPYEPTIDEILRTCRKIRSSWSEQEHRVRSGTSRVDAKRVGRWAPPVVTLPQSVQENLANI